MLGKRWVGSGLLHKQSSPFVSAAAALVKTSLELAVDAEPQLKALLSYPLEETLASADAASLLDDGFSDVATAVIAAYDSGELETALASGHDGYKVGCGILLSFHVVSNLLIYGFFGLIYLLLASAEMGHHCWQISGPQGQALVHANACSFYWLHAGA
jgi:hypothetical protein